MNNKGFAITGILYGLMLIFILALTSFLSILVGKNRRIDELEKSVYENLELKKKLIILLMMKIIINIQHPLMGYILLITMVVRVMLTYLVIL